MTDMATNFKPKFNPEEHPRAATGVFVDKANSAPETSLATDPQLEAQVQRAREARDASGYLLRSAERAHRQSISTLIAATLKQEYPTAASAVFERYWEDRRFSLSAVYDSDGQDIEPNAQPESAEVGKLLAELGDEADEYFEALEQEDPDFSRLRVDLGSLIPVSTNPFTTLDLPRPTQELLQARLVDSMGFVGYQADKSEIEYRLVEACDDYGFDPGIMAALDAKFGGREEALSAMTDGTKAWGWLEQQLVENSTELVSLAIQAAVDELLN